VNSSRDNEPTIVAADEPRTRRQLLTAGGIAAIAGVLGVFGLADPAAARNGDPIRAGQKTASTRPTSLVGRKGTGFGVRVGGAGRTAALRGQASSRQGKGVIGVVDSKKGATVGVEGVSFSPGGTAGQFVANRGGTAVSAESPDRKGVALRTEGRLQFKGRSGSTQTSGGSEFVIPVKGGLSQGSLVLATLQDHVPGVHVESASVLDAADGLIVVRLNQAVPEPARVAWFVLD
jgi:hypothetical protein